ncbi:MAG: histidine kinase famiy protein [Rhodocyclaceae bacterium]|nr:histidine kinase famiy protein [Pseudomonadota bacterium]MDQ7973846.1 histidine kinase famiy protein [Rhodocyclaceae bacterium]MDQ8001244.1 histidine kinase famiy protein [Pseudomonadota bacterium]MDQ8018919.1 histidine kinase famiy protein [Pseudomonadota bacterium]
MSQPEKPPIPGRSPVQIEDGGPSEFVSHKDDIFFAAIETTRMPMLVTDPRQSDNPIVFANRAFVAMTGYTREEIVGHNCRFLQGPATDRQTVQAIRQAIEERREISLEILNYRKDGSTFWNALFISPVYNRRDELVFFFASQLDVSRRRDAEEGLAQAQKMEALGQLTGGIAHDFNNLLQVMSGHLDLMGVRARLGKLGAEDLARGIESIRSAVTKASTLTQQLLAFSRKQKLRGRTINLNTLATGMTALVQRTLGEQVQLEFDLAPDLPNCELDTTQVEVALLNVLVNARDAMPEGGRIRIETRAVEAAQEGDDSGDLPAGLRPGGYAALSVTDTGSGIAPEIITRVMDPFFTTKDEGKGTGLGLSMVYGFARQSGGTATVSSEPGQGTTVRMFFPAVRNAVQPEGEGGPRPNERGGTETILVVEDRPEVSELARDMLEGLGYRVHVADTGRAALELVRSLPQDRMPDLLFSDVVMPGGINGYTLAREMRRLLPSVHVLLTTGYDRDMGNLDQVAPSEFDILKKPYRLSDLALRVRMALDGATGTRT